MLVVRGVLSLHERDIVLAFQQKQTMIAESLSRNHLGNILLKAGEILPANYWAIRSNCSKAVVHLELESTMPLEQVI